jgi:hypothetical protein
MYLKIDKLICLIIFIFVNTYVYSQTYTYSYIDPCTKSSKTISVPINGSNVTVSYYGNVGVFNYNDFMSGTFDNWASNVFSQFSNRSPCSEAVGLPTVVNISQNQIINTIGILNSISTITDIVSSTSSTTNMLGGLVNSVTNTPTTSNNNSENNNSEKSNNDNTKSNQNGNSNTSNFVPKLSTSSYSFGVKSPTIKMPSLSSSTIGGGKTTIGGNGSTSTTIGRGNISINKPGSTTMAGSTGNSNQPKTNETVNNQTPNSNNNNSGNGSGVNNNNNNNNNNSNNNSSETASETEGKTNITGGGTNTIKMSGGSSSNNKSNNKSANKEGGKPVIVASGDFVGFNFRNSEQNLGVKGTGGYTSMRWDGRASQGLMFDYTSAQVGPNITGFYAIMRPKAVSLISGTGTVSFVGDGSLYVTASFGQMRMFKKIKSLKLLYMGTVSIGHVQKEAFIGTAVITGGMYDFKITKRFDIKLTNLIVYSPYVSYYNDVVMKSPIVMLPSVGTTVGLTKRFKFNINFGTTWQMGGEALNYTITSGMRMLI